MDSWFGLIMLWLIAFYSVEIIETPTGRIITLIEDSDIASRKGGK